MLVLQPRPGQSQTGLGCSRFARHYYGNLMLISLRRATEMFQFTRCPPSCLCVQQAVSRHYSGGVAPFGISGLIACMQLPRNVSPVSASFFGFQRLGIHLVLYVACSRVCASASLLLFGKIEERKVFSYSCTNCRYSSLFQPATPFSRLTSFSRSVRKSLTTGEWKTATSECRWKQVCIDLGVSEPISGSVSGKIPEDRCFRGSVD